MKKTVTINSKSMIYFSNVLKSLYAFFVVLYKHENDLEVSIKTMLCGFNKMSIT